MLYLFFIKNSNRNVIVGASTLTAGNIKKGVKIFNVTGTFTGWIDNEITVFQNGTVYNHSTLGGGLTYSWGCWNWNATTKHDSSGGSVSVGTNIVLSVGSGTYSSGVLRHVGACVSSTNKIDPMFKSVKVYFNWVTSQENSGNAPRFLFGSHMNCLTNATYAASKDVTFWMWKDNRTGFTRSVNLWDDGGRDSQNDLYGWFRVGLECRLYYTNPNISSITITRITLSKTAV